MPIPSHTERPDLYDDYDCQGPSKPASSAYWQSVMPDQVKKAIAERQAQSCECFDPSAKPQWIDYAFIDMTDDYWELSRMRCARCGTPWVRGYLEYESFSRSGRHYRAPTTNEALQGITPEDALRLIEEASLRIAGGSRFGGDDFINRGPGALNSNP